MKFNGLSQDGDNFWDFVITVKNTWFHKKGDFFFTFWERKHSQHSAPHYSAHQYIYRSSMSGPSDITLL